MSASKLVLQDFMPYLLSVVSNRVSAHIARAYQDKFGLSVTEWRIIGDPICVETCICTNMGGVPFGSRGKIVCRDHPDRPFGLNLQRQLPAQLDGLTDKRC